MSSLASQLQGIASLDSARLSSRFGAPTSKSYLFPPKVAATHDLDSIFSLAQSGYDDLLQLDPAMAEFEAELFSEVARRTDRMMLGKEENAKLDIVLNKCLRRLGKWIGIMAGGKCIEWLVRRFRVNEMNAETILKTFLPYHDSPNFARMLAILTLPQTSVYYAPFSPLIKSAQPVPRTYISTAFSAARDPSLRLLTDLIGSVKLTLDEDVAHRALLGFWTSMLVDLLEKSGKTGKVPEGVVRILVENFVTLMSTPSAGPEINAAVYPPLVLLSRSVHLADAPFLAILQALLTPDNGANPSQRLLTLLVLLDQRQGWQGGLGENGASTIAKIPQLGQLIVTAMGKYGFERALQTVLAVMAEQPCVSAKALAVIVDYQSLPTSLVKLVVTKLVTETSEAAISAARPLFETLRERHPQIVDIVLTDNSTIVNHSLLSLSSKDAVFVNVHSADVSSRVTGIQQVYDTVRSSGLNVENAVELTKTDETVVSAQEAIFSRIKDEDESVINAIYAEPELLLALIAGGRDYIDSVVPVFTSPKINISVIKAHLLYITKHFLPAFESASSRVFQQLLVPVIFASENRHVLAQDEYKLFAKAGPLNVLSEGSAACKQETLVSEQNQAIVKALSASFARSDQRDMLIAGLLFNLDNNCPQARLFASIILAEMFILLPTDQQVQVANIALVALDKQLNNHDLREHVDIETPLSGELHKAMANKPGNIRTLHRASLVLLTSISRIGQVEESISWTLDESSVYKHVIQSLYRWANNGRLSPSIGRHILQSVLAQLGDKALVFLSSEWTGNQNQTRVAALRHASAFVRAYGSHGGKGKGTDFQMVVPALLVALQDAEAHVRQTAAALLKTIIAIADGCIEFYALDTFYGERSDLVQLLKPSDLQKYLQTISGALDEIVIDPFRLVLINSTSLDAQSKAGRKDALYRRAVCEWLMSHAVAWRANGPRQKLMSSLARTTNPSRLRGVVPLLASLVNGDESETEWLSTLRASSQQAYLGLLFDSFSPRNVSVLTEEGSESWALLLSLVQNGSSQELLNRLRVLSVERMVDGLFNALPRRHKVEYIVGFISSLHNLPVDASISAKSVLSKFLLQPDEIVEIVQIMLEPFEGSIQRKKAKQDVTGDNDRTELAVTDLTVLIESRDWKTLPGNAPLVASLMGVLSVLLSKRQAIKDGIDYLEQETLGAILAQVEKISDATEIIKAHVGIEVIIKVIRASTNPRTSQRALLVASELARLIPDAVLHNIMPIFTFMGTSDLQRDDAFSFSVVEKTVASIVPVMTRSLREKAESKLDLYNQSLTFVSIFTDMAGRLPRHRTVPFFIHLVKSLGPDEFLAPICMLLLDKLTTKAGRQVNGLSDLPSGLVASFTIDVRVETLFDLISEVSRLVDDLSTIAEQKQAFLSNVSNDDSERTLKQISALLRFGETISNQLNGKPCKQTSVEQTVKILIRLAATTSQPSLKASDIVSNVRSTLAAAMQLLSVEGFLTITSELLESGSEQDVTRALEVFTLRLPMIRPDLRAKCAPAIATIVRETVAFLPKRTTVLPSLSALYAVASSATSADDGALAAIVPRVISVVPTFKSESDVVIPTLSLIEVLAQHLTTRIIPYIQSTIDTCLDLTSATSSKSFAVAKQAFGALSALIESVSSFINSKQLIAILNAAAMYRATDEAVSARVLSITAKKIQTKTLFPVVMDLWKVVSKESDQSTLESFFHLLRLTLRNADRKALPNLIKPIFAFFLDVFDLRHRLQSQGVDVNAVNAIETSSIDSFLELVTKLNEVTFKPLFVRLYDWAVIDLTEEKNVDDSRLIERKIVLFHVMMGLLDKFRHLLSPYIGVLLPHIEELLPTYANGINKNAALWTLMLDVVAKSFDVDEGAFWTEAQLTKLIPALVSQLYIFPDLTTSPSLSAPARALSCLASSTTSEPLLKKLNTAICMATRAEHPKQRLAALIALDAVWEKHADEMVQFVPETVAEFLSEAMEDENDEVEGMARKVLARIETVTGSLKEYLE